MKGLGGNMGADGCCAFFFGSKFGGFGGGLYRYKRDVFPKHVFNKGLALTEGNILGVYLLYFLDFFRSASKREMNGHRDFCHDLEIKLVEQIQCFAYDPLLIVFNRHHTKRSEEHTSE